MQEHGSPWFRLRGLEPMSLCDWPGRVSAVLFLGGCDLRCPTCHNARLAWSFQELPRLSRNWLLGFLQRRAPWLDGLVVTGGEAALSEELPDWLAELRRWVALPIKLDTNGLHPAVVEQVLRAGLAELVAVDVKGPWAKYPQLTGNRATEQQAEAGFDLIFDLARCFPDRFLFRCTLVPQLEAEDVQWVRRTLPPGFPLCTQSFCAPLNNSIRDKSC
jgi:pyruvate formate lyase activating enzyme